MSDVSFDAVIIIVQVAQVRVAAAESSIQIAYLSVNDRVELDIKYTDELGRSIASLSIPNTSILKADVFLSPFIRFYLQRSSWSSPCKD
jgi:hypothetical protein